MKIDKETLIKHQFWVGFGLFVPLILITLLWLEMVAAQSTTEQKGKLDEHKAKLRSLNGSTPRTRLDIVAMEERRKELEKRREEVWDKAWKLQEDLLTWPTPDLQEKLGKRKFGGELDVTTCANYAQKGAYYNQLDQLANTFKVKNKVGLEEKSFETVRFRGSWREVLTHVADWGKRGKAPASEEVWLAQEDMWVQREILRALLEANNSVATLRKLEGTAAGKGELFRQQFANGDWKLDLVLSQNKAGKYVLGGQLKNNSTRLLPLGNIHFLVQLHQGDARPVVLPAEGDPLPAGREVRIKDVELDLTIRPEGLLSVTQLHDWARTGAIRRIDQIALGAQSHRTFMPKLLPPRFLQSKGDEKTDAKVGGAPKPAAGPNDKPTANATENGLVRDRYSEVTEQVRRLPVGIVMLVDQGHIPEVLAALASSKLRFQITQVGWHHYRGSLVAPAKDDKGGGAAKAPEVVEEGQGNLVELTIYCVASLYERSQAPAPAANAAPAPAPMP